MPLGTGQVVENRYRIVKLLGQGGFGAVYRAWDLRLSMPVALKENLDYSQEAQRQFGKEAKILARLSHPNLARVTDFFFVARQGQYLVMDFVEGESLAALVARQGVQTEAQVVPWMIQVSEALEYLHAQTPPIIHRDIKPANIIIRPDGRAVLVDFGIAKLFEQHLATTAGAKAVTPGYSPIEQYVSASRTDTRTDIYALGATFYTLMTAKVPPEAPERNLGVKLDVPTSHNKEISKPVEIAILRALEDLPDNRYQKVGEFKAALTGRGSRRSTISPQPLSQQAQFVNQAAAQSPAAAPGSAPAATPASSPVSGTQSSPASEPPEPSSAPLPAARNKPSCLLALGLHMIGGFGLFYVDRTIKRRWLYPATFAYAGLVLFLGTILYIDPFAGEFGGLTFLAALGLIAIGFIDTLITCRKRQK